MAEYLKPLHKSEKRNTTKTKLPTTPAEAGQILASALNYCKEAGLIVTGYNEKNMLMLCIEGLNIIEAQLIPVTQSSVTMPADVTPSPKAVTQ